MPTVHQATWELLRALGVRKVFGNPGSTEMPFLADFPADIDYVLALHEGSVVGMADAYAQATGEPTLVNLHTAAGLGTAMGAIVNAAGAHSPLVITAGQQVRAMLTLEPLLSNPDATTLPKPAVKWAFEPPRAQDVPAALARAFHYASLPPAGPVFGLWAKLRDQLDSIRQVRATLRAGFSSSAREIQLGRMPSS